MTGVLELALLCLQSLDSAEQGDPSHGSLGDNPGGSHVGGKQLQAPVLLVGLLFRARGMTRWVIFL